VRAVLDPNVLVSAAISETGPPAELLRRWEAGRFELVVSAEVLFDILEVLKRPKFRRYLSEAQAVAYVLRLHDGAAEVSEELPSEVVRGVTGDLRHASRAARLVSL
jgi:putative PIN family toxin of toxin-antitoxin system